MSRLAAGAIGIAAVLASASAAHGAAGEEMRVFDADLGRAWIDVSAYPPEQQSAYAVFAQKCSRCHTLARPINSTLTGDEWLAYVARMSRKAGSGISPRDADAILAFLVFDSERREREAGGVDPELLPFLAVSTELAGVRSFPASTRDLRFLEGELRIDVVGDRRLDLSRFLARDEGQDLARWTRRAPNEGQIVLRDVPFTGGASPDGNGRSGRGTDGGSDGDPAAPDPPPGDPLRAAVAEAIGAETDPRERVELILDWLDANVAREAREGTPSPTTVLAERRGDATEMTTLFVAMARAAGIPARSSVGFLARRTALWLHPWAEVLLDEWIPVDPYLGEMPASPLRIRLAAPDADALASWDAADVPGLDRLRFRAQEPEDETGDEEG